MSPVYATLITAVALLISAFASAKVRIKSKVAVNTHREGRVLDGFVMKEFQVAGGLSQCLGACMKTRGCMAFNYGNNLCQLLEKHLCYEKGLRLIPNENMSYYDLEDSVSDEVEGMLWKTPYCLEQGLCSPKCEPLLSLLYLNDTCTHNIECQLRTGGLGECNDASICKCKSGYYMANNTTCLPVKFSGYEHFYNSRDSVGRYYRLSEDSLNFTMAQQACEQDEGFLAQLEDREAYAFLRGLMKKANIRIAYIGLSDIENEGMWMWTDGKKVITRQFWKPIAHQQDPEAQDCGVITSDIDYGWDDVGCEQEYKYFCQLGVNN